MQQQQQKLGQPNTTYIYLRMYKQIYKTQQPNQFITKRPRTEKEEDDLINSGWDFMYLNPQTKLGVFRKPKIS